MRSCWILDFLVRASRQRFAEDCGDADVFGANESFYRTHRNGLYSFSRCIGIKAPPRPKIVEIRGSAVNHGHAVVRETKNYDCFVRFCLKQLLSFNKKSQHVKLHFMAGRADSKIVD